MSELEIFGGEGEGAVALELDGERSGRGNRALGGGEDDIGAAKPEGEGMAVPVELDLGVEPGRDAGGSDPEASEDAGDLDDRDR